MERDTNHTMDFNISYISISVVYFAELNSLLFRAHMILTASITVRRKNKFIEVISLNL